MMAVMTVGAMPELAPVSPIVLLLPVDDPIGRPCRLPVLPVFGVPRELLGADLRFGALGRFLLLASWVLIAAFPLPR